MKWDWLITLYTLYKSSIVLPVILSILPLIQFPILHATADDMPANTVKAEVLRYMYLEACFQVLTTTNGPVANVIDGIVQFCSLSYIYQIISRCRRNSIRPSAKTIKSRLCYRAQFGSLGVNNVGYRKYF